ncbi:MAG TPA: DedA family protein [Pseudolabrys sp.]|nr:DedA family protein [Pseudolabrys sp.]
MEDIGQLIAGLENIVRHYGAFAVTPILAIEAIGAPVPGESLLIFASVLAGRGEMSLPALLIFAWVGSVIGDNLGFLIGRKLGRKTVLRYGAKVGLTNERFSKIEITYVRYGSATVLFARFFSILRQLNGIVAGILGMSWWRFVLFDAVGAALWVAVWVFLPAYFSEHLAFIVTLAHHKIVVVSFLIVVGLILVVAFFIRRMRETGGTARQ